MQSNKVPILQRAPGGIKIAIGESNEGNAKVKKKGGKLQGIKV